MRTRRLGWLLALLVVGCIPEPRLQPRPDARVLAGDEGAAVAEANGVRLIADGEAWKGHPSNLERRLTPVEVRLENQSGRALSIRYSAFELLGASRFEYAALSPLALEEANASQPRCIAGYQPGYWRMGATWGPYRAWNRGYAWGSPWRSPWWPSPYYDPFYGPYGPPYSVRCEEPLPTQDMLDEALPEGTLESGGTVAGFLYFPAVGERERQVILQASLVDATTGERFGQLSIPFQVRR
ncbi:hypothetical protein [Hyalangium gracile]|uniref:hypothetical protein n=1 Tax=Hyalangium gracile TaxID=394092 RepID=UPI001CCB97AE|nr:hypothetical protein [Hyalangium gracile]